MCHLRLLFLLKADVSGVLKFPTIIVAVQMLNCVQILLTPKIAALQASLPFTMCWGLLKVMSVESMMPFNHPLSPPFPPTINLSQHQSLFQ